MTLLDKKKQTKFLSNFTASEFINKFRKNEITAEEYAMAIVKKINSCEKKIRSWVCYDLESFIKKAKKVDTEFTKNKKSQSLTGVPVGIKDIFNTCEFPTGFGTKVPFNPKPGNDARVVTSLLDNGAIILGKTTTAEFGIHHPPETINPIDNKRIIGTSSTGSAVAVRTGMVPIALGSQTAGSTSRPCSYLGIYGFKPSFGVLPRTAMLKTTDTLDTVTVIARSIDDLLLTFDCIRVYGRNYPIVHSKLKKHVVKNKIKIGLLNGPKSHLINPIIKHQIRLKLEKLDSKLFNIREYKLPNYFEKAHYYHELIYSKCLSYYFKNEWKKFEGKFSETTRSMIEYGFKISNTEYLDALSWQNKAQKIFENSMNDLDIVTCPSTADESPYIGEKEIDDHNLIWSLCRLPSITIPGLKGCSGLPVGIEIIGKRFDDYKVLEVAKRLDENIN